jgi:hypothetical protein
MSAFGSGLKRSTARDGVYGRWVPLEERVDGAGQFEDSSLVIKIRLGELRVTQEGQQWIANLYANVFSVEHRGQLL